MNALLFALSIDASRVLMAMAAGGWAELVSQVPAHKRNTSSAAAGLWLPANRACRSLRGAFLESPGGVGRCSSTSNPAAQHQGDTAGRHCSSVRIPPAQSHKGGPSPASKRHDPL